MNEMARIVKIDAVDKHPDADSLDICTVGGWKVVTKLGEFKSGDVAIYCRIDSWIPHALAPFLSKGREPSEFEGIKGERLRTVRLRKQLSQGLILPLSVAGLMEYFIGMDVSERLGIIKYEPPVPAQLAGVVKGAWPSAVPKTDEERIQNLVSEWPELSQLTYEVTEKLEGSSMTVAMIDNEFIVCSRNLNLKETEGNTLWAMARKYDIEARMRAQGLDNIAIQGELIGEGVQGNHYGIKGQDFYVYSIYDVARGIYLGPIVRKSIVDLLGLKHVPVINECANLAAYSVEEILEWANGTSLLNPSKLREGLVFKATCDQAHWKAVSNQYLLKHG
jgi:RNA ligase (TIGR02306 family)